MNVNKFQYLWTYDPSNGRVTLKDSASDHPADFIYHSDIEVHHPDRIDGYALPIKNGWRIFDSDMSETDPFITQRVKDAIQGLTSPLLPQIRYHGDPGGYEDYHVSGLAHPGAE